MQIPLNKPYLGREEIANAVKVIKSRMLYGNGEIGRELEDFMSKLFKVKYVFLTTSCTHAIEMALMMWGIKENDEVILPSFNFVSVACAVVRNKAKPVFVDIEDEFLNIDPERVKDVITKKTRAVICVHYAGMSCRMNELMEIGKKYDLAIIEDAAQAVGSKYRGKFLGTIGDIGCFSFHGTKNFTCGEGGAFLTNNKNLARRAEILREKGTNRAAFLRHEVNKYTWIDIGSSYVLSELLAAILFVQLKRMDDVISKRRKIGLKYLEALQELEKEGKIILPKFPAKEVNWHSFYFMVHKQKKRDDVLKNLKKNGIEASFHFLPLHLSPYAMKNFHYRKGDFPVTERISSTLIRLPLYPELRRDMQEYIIDSLYRLFK